jgi:Xaa-Pro aminopeptidase
MTRFPHPLSALQARVVKLRHSLLPHQAVLISLPTDVTYFSGFQMLVPEEREAFVVITLDSSYLIKANFSPAPIETPHHVLDNCHPGPLAQHLKKIAEQEGLSSLLYDPTSLFVEELRAIEKVFSENVQLSTFTRDKIWNLRVIKDEYEITALEEAGRIIAQVLKEAPGFFAEGMTELGVAQQVEQRIRQLGGQMAAFPTIVAFGDHGTSPHYQPAAVPLQKETSILIDAGAMIFGYRSDMTRTYWFGSEPTTEFLEIEKIVQDAYQKTLGTLNQPDTPLKAKDLDTTARAVIDKSGYGPQFIHTTGHGIGLDIHEPPSLSWSNAQLIEPGMVITVEPGVYLPEKFGYRYENTLLVTKGGVKILTEL